MGDSGKLAFGANVRRLRDSLSITQENLAEASGLDRSYIGGVERGERNPALSAILRLASSLGVSPDRLFEGIGQGVPILDAPSGLTATPSDEGLLIRFKYDQFDAEYSLPGATQHQFDEVLKVLRDGLAPRNKKADAVANSFLRAVQTWPEANPSDLWIFLINHAYCDRSNHPEAHARLNLEQSWKRTSGWALERVLVSHYGEFLSDKGVRLEIPNKSHKADLLSHLNDSRIIPDKADVLITYGDAGTGELLGVVHVKASIAERRTDDVPMSLALIEAGLLSVFWTMDAKAFPSDHPVNLGEFGDVVEGQKSDKRLDFEEHGNFSACFSYNRNTVPTVLETATARIFTCDFTNPDDSFSHFLFDDVHRRLQTR